MLLELPLSVCRVAALLQKHHYQVYLVGGSIRDLLLGTKTKDYDLTTDASPQQILTVLASWPTGLAGLPYGTVLVKDQDYPLEITSMRQDSGYRDHRHPEQVVFTSSIVADLARRDFTINAMAWPVKLPARLPADKDLMQLPFRPEDLIDPYHGQHDLARQLVRAVGKPALRLQEDALRILRALRFAATLGFQLAEETAKAVQQQAQLLVKLARERIFTELAQLLAGPHLAGVLQDHFSVLAVAVPQLQPLCRNQQAGRTARAAVLALPARFDLRLAALLQAAAKETRSPATAYASRALADLRADRKLAKNIRLMLAAAEDLPDARAGSIKMWLKNISPQTARSALLLGQAQAAAGSAKSHVLADAGRLLEQILVKKQYYQLADLALGGHDLIQLGLVAGPAVGRLLDLLLDQVILGQVPNEKEQLLQLAATLIRTEQEKP